jgi:hypothetical protein
MAGTWTCDECGQKVQRLSVPGHTCPSPVPYRQHLAVCQSAHLLLTALEEHGPGSWQVESEGDRLGQLIAPALEPRDRDLLAVIENGSEQGSPVGESPWKPNVVGG